ncbi:hypothetical protein BOTCAL_0614g00080 [Botryotinia calthae]|uniref:Cytochrome P450 n=1 Tax=Botryotinia calthae TaxID=38488 RepID=A0A4Y8CKW7_9HELO|nr:hypothetical protein BOTCAL_0614g00080 [Botryotinia calthae]
MHQKLGNAVIHVSAGRNWLYLCDSDAVNEVFNARMVLIDLRTCLRQRKITSAPFNDKNNRLVWIEGLRQADEILQFWKSLEGSITRTDKDTRTFSLHVLSGAGFGKSYSFKKSTEQPEAGHTFNYRDSLALVLENCLLILVLGPKLVSKISWPPRWKRIGQATVDFKFYMAEMLKDEKDAISHGKPRSATFTSSLLRASKEQSQLSSNGSATSGFQGFTEDEIYGNLFVYNFAGHDTTAVILNWTIYLLAAHPEVQDWISEEINTVITNDMPSTWDFKELYPRLNRCLAIMVNSPTLTRRNVMLTEMIPQRWILNKAENTPSSPVEREYIRNPPKGSYQPLSDAIRACPGKKFSQVEFVTAMVALFKRNRMEVVLEEGETKEEAKERVMSVVKDNVIVLLLQMRSPEKVGVRWVSRV